MSTGEDKVLRGRYKRLINPCMRAAVEHHYNHGMLPDQRRAFKAVVKSIFDHMLSSEEGGASAMMSDVDEVRIVQAHSIMETHATDLIAEPYQYHVISWLAKASPHQQQCFRDTMSKVNGLRLFNGVSQTKTDFALKSVYNTAENVRKRELEHTMRAQRVTELLGLWATPQEQEDSSTPVRAGTPNVTKKVTVLKRAHEASQKGAPWGTPFLHSDMPHLWMPTQLAQTQGSTFDMSHGKLLQNYNDNYAALELKNHKLKLQAEANQRRAASALPASRKTSSQPKGYPVYNPGTRIVPTFSEICLRDKAVYKRL